MEPADPSHTRSDRKDLRDLEAVIWIATNAMDGIGESLVADPPHRHRLKYEESTGYPRSRRVIPTAIRIDPHEPIPSSQLI